jgi:hypothetical protein
VSGPGLVELIRILRLLLGRNLEAERKLTKISDSVADDSTPPPVFLIFPRRLDCLRPSHLRRTRTTRLERDGGGYVLRQRYVSKF